MSANELWKRLPNWRAFGPYLLIELILPGGTLVAFLLWLSQRVRRLRIDRVHRASRNYAHAVIAPQCAAPPEPDAAGDEIEPDRRCRKVGGAGSAAAAAPCCNARWRGCVGAVIARASFPPRRGDGATSPAALVAEGA